MQYILKPHSPEWFDALQASDPAKAAHTRQIIELAGSDAVCSVCGDDPAADYKLEAVKLLDNTVLTLRLCNDCLKIRSDQGENFVPMR